MKWIETTDKNNPLSCRGEYCFDIPWLEHSTNGNVAYYSVRKDISGLWESTFWHGNRGHSVGKLYKTEMEAKAVCLEHLKRMYAEFSVQIGKICGEQNYGDNRIEFVKTQFKKTKEGEEFLCGLPEGVVVVGSIIAAQAYPGEVCALVPVGYYEKELVKEGCVYTLDEFDEVVKKIKEASEMLAKINKQLAAENAGWEGEEKFVI